MRHAVYRRVLLAEDSRTNQKAAIRMLELLGCHVDVASTGAEAVAACRLVDYSLVLMDSHIPETDGLTATREIRAFELGHGKPQVPIIALAADAFRGDRQECLAAGMNDYVTKPFKLAQLGQLLETWGHRPPVVESVAHELAPVRRESAIDSSVFGGFREAVAGTGNNSFIIELIDEYLAESTSRIAALKDAVARLDSTALLHAAHSLKGTASTVGANRMAAVCGELEKLPVTTMFDDAPALMAELEDEFTRVRDALSVERGSTA